MLIILNIIVSVIQAMAYQQELQMWSEWFYFEESKSDGKDYSFPTSDFPDNALGLCRYIQSYIVVILLFGIQQLQHDYVLYLQWDYFFYSNGALIIRGGLQVSHHCSGRWDSYLYSVWT